MSLPRVMSLDADGTLRMEELPEIASLRAGRIESRRKEGELTVVLPQANGEVLCAGNKDEDFVLRIRDGESELLEVSYSAKRHAFTAEGREVLLQPEDAPRLHGFVDASVIEMNVGGRVGYTKRFYTTGATAPDITVFARGGGALSLEAWRIAPISKNRLTTPTDV